MNCKSQLNKEERMDRPAFGTTLQNLRKEKKITQEQLATHLGVSPQAVSKWENGSYPESDLLPAIADYFDVSIDYLYGRGGGNDPIEVQVFRALQDAVEKEPQLENNVHSHAETAKLMRKILWAFQISPWATNKDYFNAPQNSIENPKTTSLILDNEFFSYMGLRVDNPFFFFMSRPENYDYIEELFKDTDGIVKLFEILSDKDNMRILIYLYTFSRESFVTAATISKALSIKREKVDKLLSALVDYSIFCKSGNLPFYKIAVVGESGEETAYSTDPNFGGLFIALLLMAKEYINPPAGFQMQVNNRKDSWADREKIFGKKK